MNAIQTAATLAAIFLAWAVFRLERHASRSREVASAKATLIAAKTAITDVWGGLYFGNEWNDERIKSSGEQMAAAVMARPGASLPQVFRVPTEPLALLAGSGAHGDLLSDRLAKSAHTALWQVVRFNQYVDQQSRMVAFGMPLAAAFPDRRQDVAAALGQQTRELHKWGVAGARDGWYLELCAAIDSNLTELDSKAKFFYPRDNHWMPVGDFLALCALAGAIAVSIVGLTSDNDRHAPISWWWGPSGDTTPFGRPDRR